MANEGSAFEELAAKAREYAIPRGRRMFSMLRATSGTPRISWKVEGDQVAFLVNEVPRIHARYQLVGFQYLKEARWRWAWADTSVESDCAKDAATTREFGTTHGINELVTAELPIVEHLAVDLASITALLCAGDAIWPLVLEKGVFNLIVLHEMRSVEGPAA